MTPEDADLEALRFGDQFHRTAVYRRGGVVLRQTGPWATAVHSLLRHLEEVGFPASPRVVGSGFDDQGRETLTYIEGGFTHPGPWSLEGAAAVGGLLRQLHDATATYRPPPGAVWAPWFGRSLGGQGRGDGHGVRRGERRVIGHCDVAPWNIVARHGRPVGLIDWEFAGPVDPLVELAQACWLNAKLHDDVVARLEGLPPLAERARQLRAMVDAYGLAAPERAGFVDRIIEFAICDAAFQADDAGVTPDTQKPEVTWALAWRARAAAWMCRHRRALQSALA